MPTDTFYLSERGVFRAFVPSLWLRTRIAGPPHFSAESVGEGKRGQERVEVPPAMRISAEKSKCSRRDFGGFSYTARLRETGFLVNGLESAREFPAWLKAHRGRAKREGFESGRNGPCPKNRIELREVKRFAKWKDKSNGRKAQRNGVERRLAASGDRARKRELIVQPYLPTLRKRQRQGAFEFAAKSICKQASGRGARD